MNTMNMLILRYIISGIFVFFTVLPVHGETPAEVMKKVLERDNGNTEIATVTLSSCRYFMKDKKIICAETPRVKVVELVRKDYGPQELDVKRVIIIREPAGERGIGFLQYDYEEKGRETDQWMYFSALDKVKRIVSGNENQPKEGSFFGTELNYEDIEKRHLEDYAYRLLAEETYRGRPCRVIESIPTPERARRSNYSKTWDWVDTERYLILKRILFNRQGKRAKRIVSTNVARINGIWVAQMEMVNGLLTGRLTRATLDAVTYNVKVSDSFLTQRALTDKAFRERHLHAYRSHLE